MKFFVLPQKRMCLVVVLLFVACGRGDFFSADKVSYCHGDPSFKNNWRPGLHLLQLQIITRHGDRTPVHALPSPLENVRWECPEDVLLEDVGGPEKIKLRKKFLKDRQALKGNCMLGQLTDKGEKQLNALGANARSLYIDKLKLLPTSCSELDDNLEQIKLRSTDVDRTIKSAYHFIGGLFPSCEGVVDLEVVERPRDNAFPNRLLCPHFGETLDSLKQGASFTSFMKTHLEPLQKKYARLWKLPVDLHVLDDTLRTRFCHALPLPPLMDVEDAEKIMKGVSEMENLLAAPMKVQQLSLGSFFEDWIENFELVPRPKLVLYSNHDSTLRVILSAFKVFDAVWPPYASHIALELWEDETVFRTGKRSVVLQYDGKSKVVEGCGDLYCPYEKFVSILRSFNTNLCNQAANFSGFSIVI